MRLNCYVLVDTYTRLLARLDSIALYCRASTQR